MVLHTVIFCHPNSLGISNGFVTRLALDGFPKDSEAFLIRWRGIQRLMILNGPGSKSIGKLRLLP